VTTEQEPAYRCTHCPRLLNDRELGRPACFVCEERAVEQVRAFPGFYRDLEAALRPGRAPGATGRVTTSRGAPLPVALQPLSLRGPGGIVSMLLGIEQRWRIALDWERLPERGGYEASLAGTVEVIANNMTWACAEYPYVAPDLKLINSLHRQADAVVNDVQDQRVPIGYCPAVNEETSAACGERLKVSPWALNIRCTACGTKWDRDEWLRLGAALRGLPAPVVAA
jgi:DNA-directed RNA polymerase subunit RPC12/RpoP